MRRLGLVVGIWLSGLAAAWAGQASILPQGATQFLDNSGAPLAGGTVAFYIPNTTTPKTTWQDTNQTVVNTNPLILDAGGRAVIYGTGQYTETVRDVNGNLIWSKLTQDTEINAPIWGGLATGTGNAQIVNAQRFSGADGQQVLWVVSVGNTGAATLATQATGIGPIQIKQDTSSGSLAQTGGELVAGNVISSTYYSGDNAFHFTPSGGTGGGSAVPVGTIIDFAGVSPPAGYLLAYGECVSQATYPALFTQIGTNYGTCGGGQFAVPDLRGRVAAGVDNMGGAPANRLTTASQNFIGLAGVGGVESLVLTIGQLPVFTPSGTVSVNFSSAVTIQVASNDGTTTFQGGGGAIQQFFNQNTPQSQPITLGPTSFPLTMAALGSGNPTVVVQPTLQVNKAIKF